jgi:hypothetical protein
VLSDAGAAASREAGGEAMTNADLRGSTPFGVGAPDRGDAVGDVLAGTLHVAVPYDTNWSLTVDGEKVVGRRAFGSTLAFDVPSAGHATLAYDTPVSRSLWLVLQLIVWAGLVICASRVRPSLMRRRKRRVGVADASPVVDLTAPLDLLDGELPWKLGAEETS